jgi:hypothetical protein
MKKIIYFLVPIMGIIIISCKRMSLCGEKLLVNEMLSNYCNNYPSTCTDDFVCIDGYLDKINVYNYKFMFWKDSAQTPYLSNAFDNTCLEVFYPDTNLIERFNSINVEYRKSNIRINIDSAKILVFHRNCPGYDDGNYLYVENIKNITFIKINSDLSEDTLHLF